MIGNNSPNSTDQALAFLLSRIDYERTMAANYGEREFRLDRMHRLLDLLGNPQRRLKIIHVAGTKGKGSTSAMIAAALTAAGYRTGLFTSPHLHRLEERFVIDGQPCTAAELAGLVEQIRPVVEQMDAEGIRQNPPEPGPTYFEITTAIALLYFAGAPSAADKPTDFAVLEVGMGGRLDSTNVCQPLVSVITSISFDHTQQLGNTLAKIAAEKAGIIKPGVPVISGVNEEEPRQVIAAVAHQRDCRLIQSGIDFDFEYYPPQSVDVLNKQVHGKIDFRSLITDQQHFTKSIELGLIGRHQAANAAVALATLDELVAQGGRVPEDAIRRGLANVHWPARVEIVSRRPTVVIDAAHNTASIDSLLQTLGESFVAKRRLLVFATTRDKDVRGMLQRLLPRFDAVILTRYLNNPRAVEVLELEHLAKEISAIPKFTCADPAAAWQKVCELATADDLICATGSFFLAAEMRSAIAMCPLVIAGQTSSSSIDCRPSVAHCLPPT